MTLRGLKTFNFEDIRKDIRKPLFIEISGLVEHLQRLGVPRGAFENYCILLVVPK